MVKDFKALKLKIASPDLILEWSKGEVKKAETINYRTQRAEVDGLFCERIFGPEKNYECYCGKYKKIRYKGIICDKCGVEVTTKSVRRERMGHIALAAPVAHVWYAHGTPNKLAAILDIPAQKLESVIYFSRYLVTEVNEEKKLAAKENIETSFEKEFEKLAEEKSEVIDDLKKGNKLSKKGGMDMEMMSKSNTIDSEIARIKQEYLIREDELKGEYKTVRSLVDTIKPNETISEDEYSLLTQYAGKFFRAKMGAEAVQEALANLDLDHLIEVLTKKKDAAKTILQRKKVIDRIKYLQGLKDSETKPEWLVLQALPVIPPDLRPIVQLAGGRFATSDLNDLYRRVINRNNRLKKLIEIGAPELILRNEKRMLQESVDALIDNSHRVGNPVLNSKGLPYRSLSDILRGKSGRFRQNILGKRVDYSGRSVIVVGPELKVNQCGLPQAIGLELFRPYIIHEIIVRGFASNTKSAKVFFEERHPEVFDILEDVVKGRPVLLNRAPTLHKQSIQAFYPIITKEDAIRINPLVCSGFGADFDGDQMAVHLPLSKRAQEEAIHKMMPDSNILIHRDGSPVISAAKDPVTGCYYLTQMDKVIPENPETFLDKNAAIVAYHMGKVSHTLPIRIPINGKIEITTVGRIMFNEILPDGYKFLNVQQNKGSLSKLVAEVFVKSGAKESLHLLDAMKVLGMKTLTKLGLSIGMEDYKISPRIDELMEGGREEEKKLLELYNMGLVTDNNKVQASMKIWDGIRESLVKDSFGMFNDENPLMILDYSGGVSARDPIGWSVAMKGFIVDVNGKLVQLPLTSNYANGFSGLEYFVSAKGARKGMGDKYLKTSKSGYLTRKLCDVSQDVITTMDDCGTVSGIYLKKTQNRRQNFTKRLTGRYLAEDITSGETVYTRNTEVTESIAKALNDDENVTQVKVRSVLVCEAVEGVCCKCYGYDMSLQKPAHIGFAAGIVAGQVQGEASTQLTMDSKHGGAKVGGVDITQGLPRLEELFEVRTPKFKALIAEIDGIVRMANTKKRGIDVNVMRIENDEIIEKAYQLKEGDEVKFTRAKKVKKQEGLVDLADGKVLAAPIDGYVEKTEEGILFKGTRHIEVEYTLTSDMILRVQDGDTVIAGQQISEGSIDAKDLMRFGNLQKAEQYLIDNIQEVWGTQGISIDDKHIEVVVRKMAGFVRIVDAGDSLYIPGDVLPYRIVKFENLSLKEDGKRPAKFVRQLLGISTAAKEADGFLSAASFQEQVKVLSEAAIKGKVDYLKGLKENVIIGRLLPLGENSRILEDIVSSVEED